MKKCQTCQSFKRTSRDTGECHNLNAIALHDLSPVERMSVFDQHSCKEHQPKAIRVSNDSLFRAAFMGASGGRD